MGRPGTSDRLPRRPPPGGRAALRAALLALVWASTAYAVHLSPQGERGEALFQEKCAPCHTIGGGRSVGPDLANVTTTRDRQWLVTMIVDPGALVGRNDPTAMELLRQYKTRMPDLGISPREADVLIAYMAEASAAPPEAAPPPAGKPIPAAGDPAIGKKLFAGTLPFANGAPACATCHGMAGIPGGGGSLGIDLTDMYENYGEDGTMSILADLPFPTMMPIYANRPLTPEEQAHLAAFLRASAGGAPPEAGIPFALIALAGAAILAAAASLLWGRRLEAVRRPLTERTALRRKPPP